MKADIKQVISYGNVLVAFSISVFEPEHAAESAGACAGCYGTTLGTVCTMILVYYIMNASGRWNIFIS
jgi:hypothetical protein